MENRNFEIKIKKVKELLNKILSENLDIKITKLESKSNDELSILSALSNSSTIIINNINQYSNKIKNTMEKKVEIPELKLDNIKSNKINVLEGILKNSKFKNTRNKENPSFSMVDIDDDISKTKVTFWQKDLNDGTPERKIKNKLFMTQNNNNKKESKINKTFIKFNTNKVFSKKRKKKSKLKINKCLTERSNELPPKTPLKLTLHRKICKNTGIHNINCNTNTSRNKNSKNLSLNLPSNLKKEIKTKKNENNTTIYFYGKKSKNIENIDKSLIPIFQYESKTPEKKRAQKEIINHEKNLKSLCESMLVDVDKDELLVSHSNLNEVFGKTVEREKKFKNNFKYCIKYFLQFLTFNELFNLCKTKKEILKIILNILINQTEKSIDSINSILKIYNTNNNKDLLLSKKFKPFELNSNSQKSISLLNSISKINFIKSIKSYYLNNNIDKNIKKIILIFDLYFISIGKKNILNKLNSDNNKKIEYICNYFKNNKSKLLGNIIENDLKNKKFDDLIINNLYEYSIKYIDIINPYYYKKINKDIAIFVFIIKNILDFIGISNINNKLDKKNSEQKSIIIHKSRLNAKNIVLDKLNQILNKFD